MHLPALLLQLFANYAVRFIGHEPLHTSENIVLKLRAEDGRPFALRISKTAGSDPAALASELALLRDFGQQTGALVPVPLPARDGRLFCSASEGSRDALCVVFHWLPGVHLADDDITPDHMAAMARATARLHAFAAAYRPPPGFVRPVYDESWFFETESWQATPAFVDRLDPAHATFLQESGDAIRTRLGTVPRSPDSFGLIHYDLHPGNFLFDGPQARMLDFDECGFGFFLFDLAHLLFEFIEHPRAPDFRRAALEMYAQTRNISAVPDADLNLFLALQGIAYVNWLHRVFRRDGHADGVAYWLPVIVRRLRTVLDAGG